MIEETVAEELAQLRVQVSRLELQIEEERTKRDDQRVQFQMTRSYEVDEQVKNRVQMYFPF